MSDLVDCLTQHVIAFVTADLHRTQEPHVEVRVPVLVWKIYKCVTVTRLLFECQCFHGTLKLPTLCSSQKKMSQCMALQFDPTTSRKLTCIIRLKSNLEYFLCILNLKLPLDGKYLFELLKGFIEKYKGLQKLEMKIQIIPVSDSSRKFRSVAYMEGNIPRRKVRKLTPKIQ